MYLYINNKKIKVIKPNNFFEKIKSFRFKLDEIDYALLFNKKIFNTYFFCQNIDIIFTDENNKVIKILQNVKSEKIIISPKNTKNVYLLNKGLAENIKLDDYINTK